MPGCALARVGDGRFIVVASAHALVASPFKAAYVAAKHGVLGLVKTLALEGADPGIMATAFAPATCARRSSRPARGPGPRPTASPRSGCSRRILELHAVKRLIEPEDVAGVVAFLPGPDGGAFTGAP